jgi:hypothetical protein
MGEPGHDTSAVAMRVVVLYVRQQKIRLFRAAVAVLGDPGAVRKIGQFMLRSRIALPLLVLLRALGSPEQVLRNVAKANSRFSTNSTVQALEVGNGHAVVSYRLHQEQLRATIDEVAEGVHLDAIGPTNERGRADAKDVAGGPSQRRSSCSGATPQAPLTATSGRDCPHLSHS